MSMDMTIDDLEDEIYGDAEPSEGGLANLVDDDDEPARGRSVRETVEKAWEKHGGELPEERKTAREERKERRAAKPNGHMDTSREAPKGDPAKQVSGKPEGQDAAPTTAPAEGPSAWWKGEGKVLWDRLDPQAKALITQRENLMTQGARQLQERYGGIHRLTQALAHRFQRYNLTPDRGFANMASWFEAIENNPLEGIRALAQLYKVDASKLGAASPQPLPGRSSDATQVRPPADPRIDQLVRWAGEMQQTRSNEVQLAKLAVWSPNKTHFDNVRATMGDLLEHAVRNQDPRFLNDAGTDVDLDKLYDAACRVHPEVGPALIEEKAKADREARQARLLQKRQAGSSMRPGTPGGAPLKGEQQKKLRKGASVREHVEAAWDELSSA